MRYVLIENNQISIGNSQGETVWFETLEEFHYYSDIDISQFHWKKVTYEPVKKMNFWYDPASGVETQGPVPDDLFEAMIASTVTYRNRQSDLLYGLDEAGAYSVAITNKLSELDVYRDFVKNLEHYQFTWNDGTQALAYVDDTSIEKMLTICRGLQASDLVLTVGGYWKTATIDGVENLYVQTTVGELTRMRDEMIVRGLQNWSICDGHKKLLKEAMKNKTMTPRQILDYEGYKTNWSLT